MENRDTIEYILEQLGKLDMKISAINAELNHTPVHFIKRLTDTAKTPTKAHFDDCGWDIYSDIDVELPYGIPVKISTGIAMQPSEGYHAFFWDKSGVGANGVKVLGGLIDCSFRGECIVMLINLQQGFTYSIKKGQKITQMFFMNLKNGTLIESSNLSNTTRNDSGFGSSGLF